MSDSTKTPAKPPLLALPAELRNQILHYALVKSEVLYFQVWDWSNVREPPLLYACKQLRKEGLPVFYGGNYFAGYFPSVVMTLLQRLPQSKLALLKRLRIVFWDTSTALQAVKCVNFEKELERMIGMVDECAELSRGHLSKDTMLLDTDITGRRSWMPTLQVQECLEKKDRQALLELAKKYELPWDQS